MLQKTDTLGIPCAIYRRKQIKEPSMKRKQIKKIFNIAGAVILICVSILVAQTVSAFASQTISNLSAQAKVSLINY